MPLPVSVVVPHQKTRDHFFRTSSWPSIHANDPAEIIIEDGPGGPAAKRNAGVRRATQPYLFFCDDDVVLAKGCLHELLAALGKAPAAGYAYSNCIWVGRPDARVIPGRPAPTFPMAFRAFDPVALRQGNYIPTMSMVRREIFPGFDEALAALEDWDLWLTLLGRGVHGVHVPKPLYQAHFLDAGVTGRLHTEGGFEAVARAVKDKHKIRG